jgi:hypothetical protein
MFLAGPAAPATYVQRGDRRIMLVRPGPAIEPHLLGIESLLPIQVAPAAPRTGARALLVRLLVDALHDAGLLPPGGRWHRRENPRRSALARDWLAGRIDREVALPVALVADALGVDPTVLAVAVARAPSVPAPSRRRGRNLSATSGSAETLRTGPTTTTAGGPLHDDVDDVDEDDEQGSETEGDENVGERQERRRERRH